ncbi:MAG TPA: anthranilate synthase component I family protein [Pirellulaceae bacterium]|nr:anthranilate synthase component I family protein [Pirellulaceae bacterium]
MNDGPVQLTPRDVVDATADRSPDGIAQVALIEPALDATAVRRRLAGREKLCSLDSASPDAERGRYSFLCCDPFEWFESPIDDPTGFDRLAEAWRKYAAVPHANDLPPFQGGAAGALSYDLAHRFERLPRPRFDDFALPVVAMGLYDVVIAFDRLANRTWIVSQGFPETEPSRRRDRAKARMDETIRLLFDESDLPAKRLDRTPRVGLSSPSFAIDPRMPELRSDFDEAGYIAAVERAREYVFAGDIFQVNLSQRLTHSFDGDPLGLYETLCEANPAPFAAYLDAGEFQILSASPERFLQVQNGWVETRPIKGTRRRLHREPADLYLRDDLVTSAKDRAENVMIVDLMRNDLSRVCLPQSVRVTALCKLETYQYVQHLVSAVEGRLSPGNDPWTLLAASFPGGSITGAPKVRAMEIVAELEPTARGFYCGSAGYVGFDGWSDLSILIRTLTAAGGQLQLPAGGGITAGSDPHREYEETWHKARGLLQAIRVHAAGLNQGSL